MLNKGSLLVLASQFVAVAVHGLAKSLETHSIDPQQILQVRMFITLSINSLFLKRRFPKELPLGRRENVGRLLALRAVGGICGAAGFYYSLEYLPLADATILNFLAPLGASFCSAKRLSLIQVTSVAICFFGVGLIAKPHFIIQLFNSDDATDREPPQTQLGFAFAMIGVIGGVIGDRSHPLVITNCFAAGVLLVSSICFAVVPAVTTISTLDCYSGVFLEYLLTAGLSQEEDGSAVQMIYFQVVLALLVDGLVWHVVPDVASCSGALLVILALSMSQNVPQKEKDLADIEMAARL
ncbi:integral membrane duf6 protein [Rutstroemia sp. NJR-2017a WRK4]|nr:integral membrane duf6 protein [Rutstroemia sp. NJR-2017a WRK4]